jgi:hypothetical protein
VLLISGFLDSATPPENGEKVARYLPNNLHIVVRYGSHSYTGMSPCVDNVMADFILRGSSRGIETSCVDRIPQTPFQVSTAQTR